MQHPLIGSWTLDNWAISYSDSDKLSYPFGDDPEGLIVYTHAGWMTAVISRSDRESFPEDIALRSLPDATLAKAYKSFFQYAGPFRIEGDTAVHTVAMSLNPNFVGSEQRRKFVFDGDLLTLSGEETIGEQTRYHKILWRRIADEAA